MIFAVIAALMMLEQFRPNPESFDKREFFDHAEALVPQLAGVAAGHVVYDGSMLVYRHHIAAMWAGMWARVPVMNGFSGAQPPGYPGMEDRLTIRELRLILGPEWHGKIAVIEWGPPVRRTVYQLEPGGKLQDIESQ